MRLKEFVQFAVVSLCNDQTVLSGLCSPLSPFAFLPPKCKEWTALASDQCTTESVLKGQHNPINFNWLAREKRHIQQMLTGHLSIYINYEQMKMDTRLLLSEWKELCRKTEKRYRQECNKITSIKAVMKCNYTAASLRKLIFNKCSSSGRSSRSGSLWWEKEHLSAFREKIGEKQSAQRLWVFICLKKQWWSVRIGVGAGAISVRQWMPNAQSV